MGPKFSLAKRTVTLCNPGRVDYRFQGMNTQAPMNTDIPPSDSAALKSPGYRPGLRSELTRQVLETHLEADVTNLQRAIRRSAHWFYWVAALSLINSLVAIFGGHFIFLAGLAVSQIADGFAAHIGFVGPYFSIGIDLVIAFFVFGFGYLASHGSRNALIVGMVLYALDGVVFLMFSAFVPALFHAFVLYRIADGWMARGKLDRLRAESPTLAAAEAAR